MIDSPRGIPKCRTAREYRPGALGAVREQHLLEDRIDVGEERQRHRAAELPRRVLAAARAPRHAQEATGHGAAQPAPLLPAARSVTTLRPAARALVLTTARFGR